MLLGWDTDEFPYDVYTATNAMLEVLRAGGLTGGFNFDAKNRRPSNTPEDMFYAFILGMDTFALGLKKAAAIIEDGRLEENLKKRYESFNSEIGQKIRNHSASLEELSDYACAMKKPELPVSGRQEYLQSVVNSVLFK
jgi:xylose isomerase